MRFMVIVKATEDVESGVMPTASQLAEMGRYDEELVKAGIMLAGEGLHPSSLGARVRFGDGGARTVIDGPFMEAGQLVAGFWLLQTKTREECLEWVRRIPFQDGQVEVRQVVEAGHISAGSGLNRPPAPAENRSGAEPGSRPPAQP